jgi:hypothetical protein
MMIKGIKNTANIVEAPFLADAANRRVVVFPFLQNNKDYDPLGQAGQCYRGFLAAS